MLSTQELEPQRQFARAPRVKPKLKPCSNAALLQLRVDDLKRIAVETLRRARVKRLGGCGRAVEELCKSFGRAL